MLARNLWRHRTTTFLLVLTLGPALGGVVALFTALDRVLLADYGIKNPSQILHLSAPYAAFRTRPDRAQDIHRRAFTSQLIRIHALAKPATVFQLESEAMVDWGLRPVAVSPGFFDLVGVAPQLGSPLTADDVDRRPRPVIISDRLWRTRFGADPHIVGRTVDIPGSLQEQQWTITGIMPKNFDFPPGSNFWLAYEPNSFPPSLTPDFVRVTDRTAVSQLERELPSVVVTPFSDYVLPQGARMILFIFIGATLFVIVAWIQVSTRILAQLAVDAPAIAVRLSLGANVSKLVSEVALEAALLGLLVLAVALATAFLASRLLVFVLPPEFFVSGPLFPGWRSWVFASGIVVSGTLLWIVAARNVIARSAPLLLRRGLAGGLSVHSARIARRLLVLQMAVVTALLYLAFLAHRSYQKIAGLDLGFAASSLVATPIPVWAGPGRPPDAMGPSIEAKYRQQSLETINAMRRINGVSGASFTNVLPLSGQGVVATMNPGGDPAASLQVVVQSVGLGFVEAVGASLVAGQEPEPSTTRPPSPSAQPLIRPAVINERLAHLLSLVEPVPSVELWASPMVRYRIVGVIRDIPTGAVFEPARPALYAYIPENGFGIYLMVRSQSPSIKTDVRNVMTAIWGESLAPKNVISISDTWRGQAARYQAGAVVFDMLVVLTFPLALVGIAASIADDIRSRVLRTTIESALGASPSRIRASILIDVLYRSAIGICGGMVMGVTGGVLARSALFGVHGTDPAGIVICSILPLVAVGLVAAVVTQRAGDINFGVLRRVDHG